MSDDSLQGIRMMLLFLILEVYSYFAAAGPYTLGLRY